MYDMVKLICSFINPAGAKEFFMPPETVENTGFAFDLAAMDPNFDISKYSEYMEMEIE